MDIMDMVYTMGITVILAIITDTMLLLDIIMEKDRQKLIQISDTMDMAI